MLTYLLAVAFYFSQQSSSQITLCPGTWSDWAPSSGATCNDTCGMCGQIQIQRSCQPMACSCDDPTNTTMMGACGDVVCLFPRRSCCPPYEKRVIPGGGLVCDLPSSTTTTAVPGTTSQ